MVTVRISRPFSLLLVGLLATAQSSCKTLRDQFIEMMTPSYEVSLKTEDGFTPVFDEKDTERDKIKVRLGLVADGFIQITGIAFVPNRPDLMIVLEKAGRASLTSLKTGKTQTWFQREVPVNSEQGLLGIAFDPKFEDNGRFFVYESIQESGDDYTQLISMTVNATTALERTKPELAKVILRINQPYPNHNAGQIRFGEDGFLYLASGDGGWVNDPENYGQNKKSFLGKILRLDVTSETKQPYIIPPDNPFVGDNEFLPEIYAWGFRNPWRFSFDPTGRMIVADLGQDRFEEVSFIESGDNAGWKIMEASHCFEPEEGCTKEGLRLPFYQYGRDDGGAIIGGYVHTSDHISKLEGLYVFGDFLSGRLWALELPKTGEQQQKAFALGRWPFLPTTFGRDSKGRLYVGAYTKGTVHRLEQ